MTWRRYNQRDTKDDYRVIGRREVLDKNLFPCADCGDKQGRYTSWAGNLERNDLRIYRGGPIFHYITRRIFFNPESWDIQRGAIRVRCQRYIAQPNQQQIEDAKRFVGDTHQPTI